MIGKFILLSAELGELSDFWIWCLSHLVSGLLVGCLVYLWLHNKYRSAIASQHEKVRRYERYGIDA